MSLCVIVQKTGRALQALNRITCLQRQSANSVHGAKSSQASSSGHSSVVSERSSCELKDGDENDLSEVMSRSLVMTGSEPSSCDSGIDRSISMYGQILNDVSDDTKYQSPSHQKVELTTGSDGLQDAPFKPSSPPGDVYKTERMQNRMSASDSGFVGSNPVYGQTPSDDGDGGDVECRSLTKHKVELINKRLQQASSKARSLSQQVCHSEKMENRMSVSDTGERSDDVQGSVTTYELDVEGQQALAKPDVDAFSTAETSSSTGGKLTPSETSLVYFERSSSTVDKLENRTPRTTASTEFVRNITSTSGNQEPPRRRVKNPEFLTESKSSKPRKPPVFVRKMKNVNVVEGETARFDVRVAGNPVPSLTWHKNGVELAIDSCKYSVEAMVEEGRWSLVICSCTKVDKAEYSCTAASDVGKISCRSQLVVEPTATGKH